MLDINWQDQDERFAFPNETPFPPRTPEQGVTDADLALMQHQEFGSDYKGLRDVWCESSEVLAAKLMDCQRSNAWPDWLAFFRRGLAENETKVVIAVVMSAIKLSGWGQSGDEVLREVQCRDQGGFVYRIGGQYAFHGELLSVLPPSN